MMVLTSASAEQWEAASAQAVVPLRVTRMLPGFQGSLTRYELGLGVAVVDAASGGHDLARTPQLIDSSGSDGVLLEICLGGTTVVGQYGREVVVKPGEGALYDTRSPYRLRLPEDNRCVLLHIPRGLLAVSEAALHRGVACGVDDRLASYRLLRGYVELMLPITRSQPDPGTSELSARVLAELASAVVAAVAGQDGGASREQLLSGMQVTVQRELANPALTPAFLAARHHVSLRTVHTVFGLLGQTPAAYIRAQRLERARTLLAVPGARVLDVAVACGFHEVSTFVRAFRRAHGLSPSEFRAARTR